MSRRRSGVTTALSIAVILLAAWWQQRAPDRTDRPDRAEDVSTRVLAGGQRAGFDFYLLALTLEPAFCEERGQAIAQCRSLDDERFARTPLVLHGLWPENRQPETYPRDCRGGRLELDATSMRELTRWMPGVSEGLHIHEWRKHGRCTGLSGSDYYRSAIRYTELANAALGPSIIRHAGRAVSAATLRAEANAARPRFGQNVVFVCKNLRSRDPAVRGRAYLTEVRVCLDDGASGEPEALLECAAIPRRDQGCGQEFWIDEP